MRKIENIISGVSDLKSEAVRGCVHHGGSIGRRLAKRTVSPGDAVRDASVVFRSVLKGRISESTWKRMNRLADELPAAVEETGLTLAVAGATWVSRAGRKR